MNICTYRSNLEINRFQWKLLADNALSANFFQTPECYDFYETLSFLKPFVFGVSENSQLKGVICGYLIADGGKIKRFFSRRAIIHGGALLSNDISETALQELLTTLKTELSSQSIYIEIRNYSDFSCRRQLMEENKFHYVQHFDCWVDTTDITTTFAHFSKSKQRQIVAAQKAGFEWSATTDIDEITDYYRLLQNLYRTKVKRPLFPLEFFLKLSQHANGKLLVVKKSGKVVGGMACAVYPEKKMYEWFVCGDILATYAGMAYAAEKNIPYFDFMGAGKPDEDYGVRKFKSKFGGKLVEYGRFLYICNNFLYRLGYWAIRYLYSNEDHKGK